MIAAACLLVLAALLPQDGLVPVNAVERYEPRVIDATFEVRLGNVYRVIDPRTLDEQMQRRRFTIDEAPVVLPMILRAPYSKVDVDSLRARAWGDGREDATIQQRARLDRDKPFDMQFAVLPLGAFSGEEIRWQIGFRSQVWSSRVNEEIAARATWPREWPATTTGGLDPQMFIESDQPVFRETVERISEGRLRLVAPYLAAKDIVRYCTENVRVTRNGDERREHGTLHGLRIAGAAEAARKGEGSPHDLVCVSVAMLRAAGIPARPVIGIWERDRDDREMLISWGEFFLPGSGWVPFDPMEMRKHGLKVRSVSDRWPGFGSLKDLNERVPLSYFFHPPADVVAPEFPAVWGWDPRPQAPQPLEQIISVVLVSRGRGVADP